MFFVYINIHALINFICTSNIIDNETNIINSANPYNCNVVSTNFYNNTVTNSSNPYYNNTCIMYKSNPNISSQLQDYDINIIDDEKNQELKTKFNVCYNTTFFLTNALNNITQHFQNIIYRSLMTYISCPFTKGSIISINGHYGKVKKINLMYLELESNNKTIYIPTSILFNQIIVKYHNPEQIV